MIAKVNKWLNFLLLLLLRPVWSVRLFALSLYRSLGRLLWATFGVYISVVLIVAGFSLKEAIQRGYQKNFLGELPIRHLKITPPKKKRANQVRLPFMSFVPKEPVGLTWTDYKKIRKTSGLTMKGVLMPVHMPVVLKASFLGRGLRSDVVLLGVSRSLVWRDLSNHSFRRGNGVVPVLLPKFVMSLYNSFADINGLPRLTPKGLRGIELELTVGKSSFGQVTGVTARRVKAKIVGVSALSGVYGLLIPLPQARSFNRMHPNIRRDHYSVIYAKADSSHGVAEVSDDLEQKGYRVQSAAEISRQSNRAVRGVTYLLYALLGIILFFTAFSMIHGFMAMVGQKRREYLLFRVLGASKIWIVTFLLLQVSLIAAFYGFLGRWSARWLMAYGNEAWFPKIQALGLPVDRLFIPVEMVVHWVPYAAVFFSVAVVLLPAVRAAYVSLSRSLDEP